jgi:hypothetical protein
MGHFRDEPDELRIRTGGVARELLTGARQPIAGLRGARVIDPRPVDGPGRPVSQDDGWQAALDEGAPERRVGVQISEAVLPLDDESEHVLQRIAVDHRGAGNDDHHRQSAIHQQRDLPGGDDHDPQRRAAVPVRACEHRTRLFLDLDRLGIPASRAEHRVDELSKGIAVGRGFHGGEF